MKVTLKIEGMACGMCGAHELAKAIEETGYTCTGMDVD